MSSTVWPKDTLKHPPDIERKHANNLIVFLISPFEPKDRFDEVFNVCRRICSNLGNAIGAEVVVVRADSVSSPGVIHKDIWSYIAGADAVIADVTGKNGNVMLELGVAAANRDAESVIIIRDDESDEKFLFDISPARHIMYKRGIVGDIEFQQRLTFALQYALAPAPFTTSSEIEVELPMDIDLSDQSHGSKLVGPANGHRRYFTNGIEFGSFYIFRYSWLTLGQKEFSRFCIKARMKFSATLKGEELGQHWMGIMLRSQHFYAGSGHLFYVKSDGAIHHTRPISELQKEETDPLIGVLDNFTFDSWVNFEISFTSSGIKGQINEVPVSIMSDAMPFTYNAGLIRFQTFRARAILRSLVVDKVSD